MSSNLKITSGTIDSTNDDVEVNQNFSNAELQAKLDGFLVKIRKIWKKIPELEELILVN